MIKLICCNKISDTNMPDLGKNLYLYNIFGCNKYKNNINRYFRYLKYRCRKQEGIF